MSYEDKIEALQQANEDSGYEMETRTCSVCDERKTEDKYPPKGNQCKACIAIKAKQYRDERKARNNPVSEPILRDREYSEEELVPEHMEY